ncbi:hypothetical protein EDB19DRAFT_1648195, partial [Suillus lakei]
KSNTSPLPIPPLTRSQSHHSTASKASKPISRTSSQPPTNREVLQLLADAESVVRDLRADVSLLNSQLAFEQDRADNAEIKAKEACMRFKDANDGRITLQSEIVRLTEELRLYKDALEQAQQEIFRAQGVMKDVEDRRRDAEESAAKSRTRLRKLMEEKMIEVAREEGRNRVFRKTGDGEGCGLRAWTDQGLCTRSSNSRSCPRPLLFCPERRRS